MNALEKLRASIGKIPYADYIVAQCYLGFRPSELLALDVKAYRSAFYDALEAGGIETLSPKKTV